MSKYYCLFLSLLSLTLLVSCGGGTSGTGGTTTRILGSVTSSIGVPQSGAIVTLEETGANAQVLADGSFAFESSLPGERFTLLVQSDEVQATTEVTDVPIDAEEVTLTLVVNRQENNVKVTEQSVVRRPTPTPRDSARPRPTRSPTSIPAATIAPAPPTSAPSPTVTFPTPRPSPTRRPPAPPLGTVQVNGTLKAEPSLLEGISIAFSGALSGEVLVSAEETFSVSALFRPNVQVLTVLVETADAFGQVVTDVLPVPDASSVTMTVIVSRLPADPSRLSISVSNVQFLP